MGKFKRDSAGIESILKSPEFAAMVHAEAEAIAGSLGGIGPVVVDDYTTDRAASSVTIKNRLALAAEANTGLLTRAAAARGLEVTSRVD